MYSFNITYDRHRDRYGYRIKDFQPSYSIQESSLNYAKDPDWIKKLTIHKINLKKIIFFFAVVYYWVNDRVKKVEEFDRIKRIE